MTQYVTAAKAGLLSCHACGQLSKPTPDHERWSCPRCGSHLHFRKLDSIWRTWALLIAGYILYLPANLLPIMETSSIFDSQVDTILSGVVYLWTTGSWVLAAIVFIASFVVPLAKLLALTLLLVLAQRRSTWQPMQRSQLYRFVDFIGRWSMLDIFVIALLVGLVQIPSVAEITAGPGALAFGVLVVLTMLASMSFDPRLTWDAEDA
ncbi:MAG TPA: paraquat-inducible protein A [Burkholderiales bacterium]|nr:paraquat-inducible protein A [Burkholderiales bacterium]